MCCQFRLLHIRYIMRHDTHTAHSHLPVHANMLHMPTSRHRRAMHRRAHAFVRPTSPPARRRRTCMDAFLHRAVPYALQYLPCPCLCMRNPMRFVAEKGWYGVLWCALCVIALVWSIPYHRCAQRPLEGSILAKGWQYPQLVSVACCRASWRWLKKGEDSCCVM